MTKIDQRTVRFQLQQEAQKLGLKSRRGGFTVDFLQQFIAQKKGRRVITLKAPPIDPKQQFMDLIDEIDLTNDLERALRLKKNNKKVLREFGLMKDLQNIINSLDTRPRKRGGKRSKRTWQDIKFAQKQQKGFSQSDWRDFRNRQQNIRRNK